MFIEALRSYLEIWWNGFDFSEIQKANIGWCQIGEGLIAWIGEGGAKRCCEAKR